MTRIAAQTTLVTVECWCGMPHAIPDSLDDQARAKGHSVYCPLGHTWVYRGQTWQQEIEASKRREQATRDLLHAEERSHQATRGHLTRAKKRSAVGVCPCCNRSFQQLARHMKSKHPDFVERAKGEAA
jgi:hypothetical protein